MHKIVILFKRFNSIHNYIGLYIVIYIYIYITRRCQLSTTKSRRVYNL